MRISRSQAADGAEGLEKIRSQSYDLVLTDMQMPNKDGMEMLREGKKSNPELPFIMLTAQFYFFHLLFIPLKVKFLEESNTSLTAKDHLVLAADKSDN